MCSSERRSDKNRWYVILSRCRAFKCVCMGGVFLAHVLVIRSGVCKTIYICFLIFEPPPSLFSLLFLLLGLSCCLLFPVRADAVTVCVWWVLKLECFLLHYYCTQRNLNMWMKQFPFYNSMCPLVVLVYFYMYHYRIWVHVKDSSWPQENQGIWVRNGYVSRRGNWQPHVCWQYYLPQSCWSVCVHKIFITQHSTLILKTTAHETPCYRSPCVCVRVSWSGSVWALFLFFTSILSTGDERLPCSKCF